ncbi:MAG: hypothetical protein M3R46_09410 [Actinomycetota bacterium]|nr:hypothetical protein [Actinomycetota bacterium]
MLLEADGFSAAQQARSHVLGDRAWTDLTDGHHREARQLALRARDDRLVLFMGAGVGIGAGLPSWGDLLKLLASDVDMSEVDREQLDNLDVRDAAGVLGPKRPGGDRFATALTPVPGELVHEVWEDDVSFVSTVHDGTHDPRRLAILLDLVSALAVAPAAHLLDRSYLAMFSGRSATCASICSRSGGYSRAGPCPNPSPTRCAKRWREWVCRPACQERGSRRDTGRRDNEDRTALARLLRT